MAVNTPPTDAITNIAPSPPGHLAGVATFTRQGELISPGGKA